MIKREPDTGTLSLSDQSTTNNVSEPKSEANTDSRPPLKEKTANVQMTYKKQPIIDDKKRTLISKIFMSSDKISELSTPRPPAQGNYVVKSEQSSLTLQPLQVTPMKGKRKALEENSPSLKMPKVDLKSTGVSNSTEFLFTKEKAPSITLNDIKSPSKRDKASKSQPPNPGIYQPVVRALHEDDMNKETPEYYEKVFKELQDNFEKKSCVDFAKMDLKTWIEAGQSLQEEHLLIAARFMEARIKLSEKFRVITNLINDRAIALDTQGEVLDQKLKKIQDLGREILNII